MCHHLSLHYILAIYGTTRVIWSSTSGNYTYTTLSIHSSIYLSIYLSIVSIYHIYLSIYLCNLFSIHLFINRFHVSYLCIYPSIESIYHIYIYIIILYISIYSSIDRSIGPFITQQYAL
jgi:hypothetical protein